MSTSSKFGAGVCSPGELHRLLIEHSYVAKPEAAKVMYLALCLGKPLLLEGPPGAGKTQVAKVLSEALRMPLIRFQCYEGIDEGKALYQWNEPLQRMALEFAHQLGFHAYSGSALDYRTGDCDTHACRSGARRTRHHKHA